MENKHTILYVDDEEENLNLFCNSFKRKYKIFLAKSAEKALHICRSKKIDLILADQRMPVMRGIDLLAQLAEEQPEMIRILITGYADMSVAVDAINRGKVSRYISKPWERKELQKVFESEFKLYDLKIENIRLTNELTVKAQALKEKNEELQVSNRKILESNQLLAQKSNEYKKLYQELEQKLEENRSLRKEVAYQYSLGDLVGRSAALQKVFQIIRDVAPTEATILILGESGTGKELAARAIHAESQRHAGPLIVVNCAALSENFLDSELFGHEKGAFTGAIRQKHGKFELAQRGTIFLDEIGDISPQTQLRLLRVLQEKTFERLGGEQTIQADVRIISATNRDLQQAVADNNFREDLYYRLNVLSITMPALRNRSEDIPLLCHHFLVRYCAITGKEIRGFTEEAMQLLMNYYWPGNIRELQNLVERSVILCKNDLITPAFFPPHILGAVSTAAAPKDLRESEKKLILKTLASTGWNKHQAAKLLNITRSTLYSKIQKYSLSPSDEP